MKVICPVPLSRILVWKIFCKLFSKHLWQCLFLVKSHAFSILFWTPLDGCIFEEHLILKVKTTFRLQKPRCEDFWWKHIKNESCKCYLGNKGQKAMFLAVPRSDEHVGFERPFFARPMGREILLVGRLERTGA